MQNLTLNITVRNNKVFCYEGVIRLISKWCFGLSSIYRKAYVCDVDIKSIQIL